MTSLLNISRLLLVLGVLGFFGSARICQAQTSTCAQYYTINTSSAPYYNVQTNYWNMSNCPTTQCMTINPNGDFTVTSGNFTCADNVATYPSIYYGCHFGNCTSGTNLPLQVSALQCVRSSWNFIPTTTGLWDAAYDIWFSTSTSTNNYNGGAELMIWLDYMPGTGAGGTLKATGVSINGHAWNVYEGPVGWNYIAYLATPTITSFNDADILAFINDSVSRGYISSSWYLAAIEAGNELRTGGVPFSSSGFSALVNSPLCGTPTFTSTPTPAATATPTNLNGYTSTPTYTFTATFTPTVTPTPTPTNPGGATSTPFSFTFTPSFTFSYTPTFTYSPTVTYTFTNTFTPTNTPSSTATPATSLMVYPNPWPDPQHPGDTITFNYQNNQKEDQVQLKVYTLSYRKIYEDDSLPTDQRVNIPCSVNLINLNLANGLYYFVIFWNQGGQQTQKVMKVLILR